MASFTATAYGPPWNSMEGSGVTSTGVNLQGGRQLPVIAVDPRVIPYGSIVRVANSPLGANKLFVAADTGGAIKGNHIDFFVASGRQAQNGWGVRNVDLQVVSRGNGPGSVRSALARIQNGQGGGMPVQGFTASAGPNTITVPKFDQAGFQRDQARYIAGSFLKGQSDPFDIHVKGQANLGSNPLLASGALLTKAPNPADYQSSQTLKLAHNALQGMTGSPLNVHPGSVPGYRGYVNPIPGAVIGRTDMGVDASGLPNGHPILAIGDSRVINIYPNWYRGQPYVLLQLLNGPKAGHYYYVAEGISPRVRPGQVVHAGEPIGAYNTGGTGLELGWGTGSSRTLAQATSGYHEGQVTPAGVSFRNFLGGL